MPKVFLIIFYGSCFYNWPNFSPFIPLHPAPPLPQAVPKPLFMSLGHAQVLWLLHFLYCTVHSHGYSVTVYLYFLLPSPLLATFFCVCNSNFLYVIKLNVIFIFLFFYLKENRICHPKMCLFDIKITLSWRQLKSRKPPKSSPLYA